MLTKILDTKLFRFIFFLMADFEKTDFLGICAQMSYYLLMAFFPLLLFLISFVGKFVEQFESYLYDILKAFLPTLSYDYVINLLNQFSIKAGPQNTILIIWCFFFATLAARAVIIGLNQTYGCEEHRSIFKLWTFSFLYTILFAVAILLIAITYLLTTDIGTYFYDLFKIDPNAYLELTLLTQIFFWPISTLLFCLIYMSAPTRHLKLKESLPGAIFATFGLNVAFRIFTFFIDHSSKYSALYGNLGGLFALLVGIYFICVILNLGGKINLYWSIYKRI